MLGPVCQLCCRSFVSRTPTVLRVQVSILDWWTHTHPFNGPFSRTTGWAGTRTVKAIWISLKQETVSGSGISWAICKSVPHSRQMTTPAPTSQFLQAGCSSSHPTNSVKALMKIIQQYSYYRTLMTLLRGVLYRDFYYPAWYLNLLPSRNRILLDSSSWIESVVIINDKFTKRVYFMQNGKTWLHRMTNE